MLTTILGAKPDQLLSAEEVKKLVRGVFEGQRLDFKRDLPHKGKYVDIAEDICAMANGAGGLIVFGFKDDDDRAGEYCPVPLGEEVESMWKSIRTRIEPYVIDVRTHVCKEEGDPRKGVLIIEVPPSRLAPHAIRSGGGAGEYLKYLIRSGRSNRAMTESEVERAYRVRRDASLDVEKSVERASANIDQLIRTDYIWAAIVPTSWSSRLWSDPLLAQDKFRKITFPAHQWSMGSGDFLTENLRLRNGRVEAIDPYGRGVSEFNSPIDKVCGLTVEGCFFAAETLQASEDHHGSGEHLFLFQSGLANFLANTLSNGMAAFDAFDVWGEVELVTGVVVKRPGLQLFWRSFAVQSNAQYLPSASESISCRTNTRLLGYPNARGNCLQEWYSQIAAAYGVRAPLLVDEEGVLDLHKFGGYRANATAWEGKGFSVLPSS